MHFFGLWGLSKLPSNVPEDLPKPRSCVRKLKGGRNGAGLGFGLGRGLGLGFGSGRGEAADILKIEATAASSSHYK